MPCTSLVCERVRKGHFTSLCARQMRLDAVVASWRAIDTKSKRQSIDQSKKQLAPICMTKAHQHDGVATRGWGERERESVVDQSQDREQKSLSRRFESCLLVRTEHCRCRNRSGSNEGVRACVCARAEEVRRRASNSGRRKRSGWKGKQTRARTHTHTSK